MSQFSSFDTYLGKIVSIVRPSTSFYAADASVISGLDWQITEIDCSNLWVTLRSRPNWTKEKIRLPDLLAYRDSGAILIS